MKRPHTRIPAQPLEDIDGETPFPDPVVLPLEDVLDLHPFAPHEIRSVVEEYLTECCAAGFTVVRLIHGKGRGVQRENVRALLTRLPFVHAFRDAPSEAGGWGATIVTLRSGSPAAGRSRPGTSAPTLTTTTLTSATSVTNAPRRS